MKAFVAALLMLMPISAVCQEPATQKKFGPFQAPQLRVLDPIVASDEGCARDFLKALKMDGLEQRKQVVDLFRYGCIERLDGAYIVNILGLSEISDGAGGKAQIRKVHLISNETAKAADGWILANALYDIGPIKKALEAARAQLKTDR